MTEGPGEGPAPTLLVGPVEPAPANLIPGRPGGGTWLLDDGTFDSVQWVLLPAFEPPDPLQVEQAYHAWSSRITAHTVGIHYPQPDPHAALWIGFAPEPWASLIRMGPLQGTRWSHRRMIQGGLLAGAGGYLAFDFERRERGVVVSVAVRTLRPRMPNWLYLIVQRRLHERATFAFLRQCVRRWGGDDLTLGDAQPGPL